MNGVQTRSELVDGMIPKTTRDSAARGGISNAGSNKGLADVLDALHDQYPNARAAIGGARKFIKECRNLAHHRPKNRKDAYQKYALSQHHFLEGLHTIQSFRIAMKTVGLTGNLAKI